MTESNGSAAVSKEISLDRWVVSLFAGYVIGSAATQGVGALRLVIRRSVKVKVKVHRPTFDTAPLRSESPPQKRSGVVRVLKEFQFHTFIRNRN